MKRMDMNKMDNREKIIEAILESFCAVLSVIMLIRVFYGIMLQDEAYYVSDAIAMINGNIPYAYNNFSYGTGAAFLIIPFLYIYNQLVTDNQGIVLFTRIVYMLFWYTVVFIGFIVLKRSFKKIAVLLFTLFMIPYAGSGILFNFSYNTIPCALSYLSAIILFDQIERKNETSPIILMVVGFMMSVAFFAHPGYGLAVAVFSLLIIWRSKQLVHKLLNLCYCAIGFISEALIVFISIVLRVGYGKLLDGVSEKFTLSSSIDKIYKGSIFDKISAILDTFSSLIPILALVGFLTLIISAFAWHVKKRSYPLVGALKNSLLLAVSIDVFCMVLYYSWYILVKNDDHYGYLWGIAGTIAILLLLILGECWKKPIIMYLGIYPILFSVAQVITVDSVASKHRFIAAVQLLGLFCFVMLLDDMRSVKFFSIMSILLSTVIIVFNNYSFVYKDEKIRDLDYKVSEGVFKGIYTTEGRSNDIIEMEKFINSIVSEDELYAFRDNVPAGYLMMHHGKMCDKATWDCINYGFGKKDPSSLYRYYQRKGEFPQKVIYVNWGNQEILSIEDSDFKYNDFINQYYCKELDCHLNETFNHIIVYEYRGGFDYNYDVLIEH